MTTRITAANIAPGAITADRLAEGVGGGPKISNIQVTDNTYTVIDDTAVGLSGGYVKITGTGFQTGCVAIIGSTTATATAFVGGNFINVQVPALAAGTYIVYVVNPDGGVAIRVNGLTYSQIPLWITGSTLPEIGVDDQISIQLSAAGDSPVAYSLLAEFTLPPGLSLSAQGLLSGSVTGLENDTVYSFTVVARDTENQDSPRTFSITVGIGDPYFYLTTLLLNGDGVNAAQNNTFLDSSNNNFAITRNGNVAQGTFSPFAAPDGRWSNYFNNAALINTQSTSGGYLSVANSTAFDIGTGDFTLEGWIYPQQLPSSDAWPSNWWQHSSLFGRGTPGTGDGFNLILGATKLIFQNNDVQITNGTHNIITNNWYHVAACRSSGTLRLFVNGTSVATSSTSFTGGAGSNFYIGSETGEGGYFAGTITNVRLIKGTALYTSNFTPSTTPLTAITNTSLLACQSNRFKDNSTNNFTITRNGDVKVTSFSPFAPTGSYSAATNGGSGYFDGSGDYLSIPSSTSFNLADVDWTVEASFYVNSIPANGVAILQSQTGTNNWIPYLSIGVNTNGTVNVNINAAGYNTTQTINAHSWNHVALVRSAGVVKCYINGQATSISVTSNLPSQNLSFWVGMVSNAPGGGAYIYYWNGYISNLRIVKGTAVYTSNFTPPTAPVTSITNTSLLLNFTNGGIIDYTGKNNLETVGNAQISTSVKKYGTGSMYFDGTGDALTVNGIHMTGIFDRLTASGIVNTIEMWLYVVSFVNPRSYLIGNWSNNGWGYDVDTNGKIFITQDGAGPTIHLSTPISTGNWQHLAFVNNGSSIIVYRNGINVGSNAAGSPTSNIQPLRIGLRSDNSLPLNGYIDDLRITKGVARYTSNFTPPASAHRLR